MSNVIPLSGHFKPASSFEEQLTEWLESPPEAPPRTWQRSKAGNRYMRAGRWVFTVFYNEGNRWHAAAWNASVKDTDSGSGRFLPQHWPDEQAALRAVEALAERLEGGQ